MAAIVRHTNRQYEPQGYLTTDEKHHKNIVHTLPHTLRTTSQILDSSLIFTVSASESTPISSHNNQSIVSRDHNTGESMSRKTESEVLTCYWQRFKVKSKWLATTLGLLAISPRHSRVTRDSLLCTRPAQYRWGACAQPIAA